MTLSDQILNDGLELHMEFGKNWLTDIDDRLAKKHPHLSKSDLRNTDRLCRKIAKFANDYVRKNPVIKLGKPTFINSSDFKTHLLNEYD
ncbi:hypothetical protein [Mangrovimonas xylaniphaga]|uniref:hypothetical protein n=1 Tax=Mangrovimonas xylaniphaga TaxID=1645915 RepID=UPI0006B5355B|nr:hypothetical protein [Mangrovimonas xylaniphaga]